MSESPARKEFPLKQIGAVIANLYARLQPKRTGDSTPADEQDDAKTQLLAPHDTIITLDDLPITNTITRRWPLAKLDYPTLTRAEDAPVMPPLLQSSLPKSGRQAENYTVSSLAEDETEEMDALPGDSAEA
jgi:hypothetical protein